MNNKLVLAILLVTVGLMCLVVPPVSGRYGSVCRCSHIWSCGPGEIPSGPCGYYRPGIKCCSYYG
ncbi:hypothetical protein KP79_PYT21735 [Mizuhopecten yessoensis]|uniref:Uncharacterized protein n=1 Tax=Mizuhopecten yessoensis TaxID=6573 RepID=A0A210R322_MIZYE|nr:hypothetical protein KP79_PYT21735 [Mizuhopecten yessoensis]